MRRILQLLAGGKRLYAAFGFALVLSLTFIGSPVLALNYGEGAYSADCAYSSDCGNSSSSSSSGSSSSSSSASSSSSSSTPTIAQTSTGLDVSINLVDGQMITGKIYQIVITPLNGQGTSFKKAEIYLDGKLVFSGVPDADGTLRWDWDTEAYPATDVKIIVYDTNDQPVTKEFKVTLAEDEDDSSSDIGIVTTTEDDGTDDSGSSSTNFWVWFGVILGAIFLLIFFILLFGRRRRGQGNNTMDSF